MRQIFGHFKSGQFIKLTEFMIILGQNENVFHCRLKFFKDNAMDGTKYKGQRDADSLEKFIKTQMNPDQDTVSVLYLQNH